MNQEEARTILLEHSRSSSNGSFPAQVDFTAKLTNPICGDHVELQIHADGDKVQGIGHKARACAICSASASLLCQQIKGLSFDAALQFGELLESTLLASQETPWPQDLAGLACFEHLRVNTGRRMCALLPWLALRKALRTTEVA